MISRWYVETWTTDNGQPGTWFACVMQCITGSVQLYKSGPHEHEVVARRDAARWLATWTEGAC